MLTWTGTITVEGRAVPNLITDAGLDLMADGLGGIISDAILTHMAWGDDNTPPAASDTQLGNEVGRAAIASASRPATGQLVTIASIPAAFTGTIEELGWFVDADATPGSGILIARVLLNRTITVLETVQVQRTDTFGRAP